MQRMSFALILGLLTLSVSSFAGAQNAGGVKRYGIVPYRAGISPKVTPTCSAPSLSYFGGPLVSNIIVVPVMWNSDVNSEVQQKISQFYADAIVSPWYDMLSEYASAGATVSGGVGGTNQSIGRGTSLPAITITPLKCQAGTTSRCTVTDAQIQTEINAQINANNLPEPELDAMGYTNTAYMVFFPPKVTVTAFGATGCVDFCAYHNTGVLGTTPIPYSAVMDTYSSACSTGCGGNTTAFENESSIASHELAELVTDTDIGLDVSNNYAYPGAWADNNNQCGEIADICDSAGAGDTFMIDGRVWTVQELWSNADNKCVSVGLAPSFAVTAPPTASPGGAFVFTTTATNPAGTHATDSAYIGTVHFTSSDSSAVLPADYTFVPEDQGVHNFTATLASLGTQTITATDELNGAIKGTSANISVSMSPTVTTLSTVCSTTFVENQSIALTASVSGSNPTGTITFENNPTIFCNNVAMTSGSAACETPALTVQGGGTSSAYNISATYSGDADNDGSTSTLLPLTVLAATEVLFRNAFEGPINGCPVN